MREQESLSRPSRGGDGDKLLNNPRFVTWVAYADDFNANFHEQATQIVSTLKGHYDDDALSRMLVVAKNVPSTKKLASGQFSVLLKISEGVRFNIPQPIDDLTGN
ncbi:hypothetical protein JG687_00001976 [Phytophthora cactorum]|uniref:Uncharacterized protein n=1 Tax=Phytophthora cactorum TaxID=29920 RepID=A0A8T1UVV4_9STRA|nr:hypothetical protein JG687_00001976 [Phytophthora cactorum]